MKDFRFDLCKGEIGVMLDYPIEPPPPSKHTVGQFREEGPIQWGKVPVPFKRIGEKNVGMSIEVSYPIQNA